MDCPRCAHPDVTTPACPRCGIILAKWKGGRPASSPAPPAPEETPRQASGAGGIALPLMALVLLGVAAVYWLRRPVPDKAGPVAARRSLPAVSVPPILP